MKRTEENERRVRVELLDQSGHTCMELTRPETLDIVGRHSGTHWVYANQCLIEAADLANADWAEMAENNTTVQLVPNLLAGV